jgi:mannose-6-phosphate isomerase-like protein (cupin superfamily)
VVAIIRKSLAEAEETLPYRHGQSVLVRLGEEEVWRSDLEPGWNWDEDLEPYADGASSCPLTHREYVVSGTIRYLMEDGTETVASGGDALLIPPGHRAWVVGEEPCVLIDWQTEPTD